MSTEHQVHKVKILYGIVCRSLYQLAIKQAKHTRVSDRTLLHATVRVAIFKKITQNISRLCLKCDGTRAETFRLSAKRTGTFKSAGASVQSTTGSRGVRISGSNAGYTMFRGSVKGTGYPLHSPVSPSLPLLCVTVCHHISAGVYLLVTFGVVSMSIIF